MITAALHPIDSMSTRKRERVGGGDNLPYGKSEESPEIYSVWKGLVYMLTQSRNGTITGWCRPVSCPSPWGQESGKPLRDPKAGSKSREVTKKSGLVPEQEGTLGWQKQYPLPFRSRMRILYMKPHHIKMQLKKWGKGAGSAQYILKIIYSAMYCASYWCCQKILCSTNVKNIDSLSLRKTDT